MEHEFYCRMRRYFRNIFYEIWSMEFDYGEGYLAEDKLIVNWCDDMPRVLCLMKSKDRLVSEEYDVQDLINIHSSIYKLQKEAVELD